MILTVAVQFETRVGNLIRGADALGILPGWVFFAPDPGEVDLRLLVRFGQDGGGVSDWQELWFSNRIDNRLSLGRALFNPYRRIDAFMASFMNGVARAGNVPSQIRLSSGYILLLRLAERLAGQGGFRSVQFMVASTNPTRLDEVKVELLSDVHRIKAGAGRFGSNPGS